MKLPEKAKELLDMIRTCADLQGSNEVMIPHKDLAEKFSTGEVELAESVLFKNKILVRGGGMKEMPSGSWSDCLRQREKIMKSPEYKDAIVDFYATSSWTQGAMMIFKLGDVETAKFSEQESVLKIGDKEIELTPSQNEFELCRVMFKHKPNEWVDWSEVYVEMAGVPKSDYAKEKRMVYDACLRINKRIEKETRTKDFFIWKGKTIKRRL